MAARLQKLLQLFRCPHEFSWPRRRAGDAYYQVCLLCGCEWEYDWTSMRRTRPLPLASDGSPLAQARRKPMARAVSPWQPRERRVRFTTEVSFRPAGNDAWLTAMVENVSRTGILFRTAEPLVRGEEVELLLEMPAEITGQPGRRVTCIGTVARIVAGEETSLMAVGITEYRLLGSAREAEQRAAAG